MSFEASRLGGTSPRRRNGSTGDSSGCGGTATGPHRAAVSPIRSTHRGVHPRRRRWHRRVDHGRRRRPRSGDDRAGQGAPRSVTRVGSVAGVPQREPHPLSAGRRLHPDVAARRRRGAGRLPGVARGRHRRCGRRRSRRTASGDDRVRSRNDERGGRPSRHRRRAAGSNARRRTDHGTAMECRSAWCSLPPATRPRSPTAR